ncbi:T9SS type A sorting domain-containing protein [Zobellia nedashkovskayae]
MEPEPTPEAPEEEVIVEEEEEDISEETPDTPEPIVEEEIQNSSENTIIISDSQPIVGRDILNHSLQEADEVEIVTYPNPVVEGFSIGIKNYESERAWYQLFDYQGRLVTDGQITSENTKVMISQLKPATYLLKVFMTNQIFKTLKILKK